MPANNSELTVADVMRTDFRSCNASTPAAEAAAALRAGRAPVLPVTRAQVPIGVVTAPTLFATLAEHGGDLSRLTAADLMTSDVPTVPMTAPVARAADRLGDAGGFVLAVDGDGLLKGLVTLAELGPAIGDAALGRIAARLGTSEAAAGAPAFVPPAVAAREADRTAEVESSKSQAQPHPWDAPSGAHPEPLPLITPADLVNPMLTVADAMTAGPRTCSPQSTALEAVMVFRDARCGVVPVTEDGRPVGVLTDRDVALALADHEADLAGTPVGDLMTTDVVTIEADATLDEAITRLGERGLRRLLVVDGDEKLVGVLSWTDLAPHLSERGMGHVVAQIVEHR